MTCPWQCDDDDPLASPLTVWVRADVEQAQRVFAEADRLVTDIGLDALADGER